jgi:hypothetical protein
MLLQKYPTLSSFLIAVREKEGVIMSNESKKLKLNQETLWRLTSGGSTYDTDCSYPDPVSAVDGCPSRLVACPPPPGTGDFEPL